MQVFELAQTVGRLEREVARLRVEVHRLAAPKKICLSPGQREVVRALHAVFGTDPVTTSEIIESCALAIGDRPALRAALMATSGTLGAQRIGLALRLIVCRGGNAGDVRLTAPRTERKRRLWCIERRVAGPWDLGGT